MGPTSKGKAGKVKEKGEGEEKCRKEGGGVCHGFFGGGRGWMP